MNRMQLLDIEILVADMLEAEGYTADDVKQIEIFVDTIHQSVENGANDYCVDHNIEDYEFQY